MPDLTQSLQGRDLGYLRIVAELWGLELDAPDARVGAQRLAEMLLDSESLVEVVEDLPEAARAALYDLLQNDGRLPWSGFMRRYGALREMGPARRDRERPFERGNASATEALWYHALVSRAFFDTSSGPEEFAYLPDDLLPLLPEVQPPDQTPLGRPASPVERAFSIPASDHLLDDACTLLAALRLGLPLQEVTSDLSCGAATPYPLSPVPLLSLLSIAGLLDPAGMPLPEPTRAFLESPRGEALVWLVKAWMRSPVFNELRLLPGLSAEGEWRNDPLRARQAALDFLSSVPGSQSMGGQTAGAGPYWSLPAFVAAVRQVYPDFQRQAGDYDAWYLRDQASGEYLRGFEHWDEVDGALIRFIIAGPLHWLGVVDLAAPVEPEAGGPPPPITAFRFSAWAADLLDGVLPQGLPPEEESPSVSSDGRVRVSTGAPRAARYQVARFSAWEGRKEGVYLYRLTPASLERARQQGLRVEHLLSLLRRQARALPPSLAQALKRWDEQGSEARLEQVTVLRLRDPELLQALRSSRAGRFLAEPLGPTAIVVKPGAAEKVLAILAEMGYLGEIE